MVDYIKSFNSQSEYNNYRSSALYARPNVSYVWDESKEYSEIVAQSGASGTFPNLKGGCLFENAVMDYDGNIYDAVVLGDQVWLGSNLRTTHYADGTPIDEMEYFVVSASGFTNVECGIAYRQIVVFSGYTVGSGIPERVYGVSPNGWHIPSADEVETMRAQLRLDYNVETYGGYYNDAQFVCSNHGWQSSDVKNAVGNGQEKNNKTSINLIPIGIVSGYDMFEKVTYNMTQSENWNWEGEYLIVTKEYGTGNTCYVDCTLSPENFKYNNVSIVVSSQFTGDTCLYRDPVGGYAGWMVSGDNSFLLKKIDNKYTIIQKFNNWYFSPDFTELNKITKNYAHMATFDFSSGVLFTVSINENDNSVDIFHEYGVHLRGYSQGYCTFVKESYLNNSNVHPIWLYKRTQNNIHGKIGQNLYFWTSSYFGDAITNYCASYNTQHLNQGPILRNCLLPVRCIYNGTVEEFIKNYRNLNP